MQNYESSFILSTNLNKNFNNEYQLSNETYNNNLNKLHLPNYIYQNLNYSTVQSLGKQQR
jgi:hypothetical protein